MKGLLRSKNVNSIIMLTNKIKPMRMPINLNCLIRQTVLPGFSLCWRVVVALSAVGSVLSLASAGGQAADVFAGQETYQKHCVRCHGTTGRPLLPNVPDFYQGEGLNASDGRLIQSIKAGSNLMPSFNRIIKDRDIFNALAYIRTFQR